MFANGNYQLILTATDQNTNTGQPVTTTTTSEVSLYSQTKLGNLTLPVTDLQVTAPDGQTLSVTRVYNSQNADVFGDFGYGWTLQIANTSVSTTAQESSDYGGVAYAPGDVVYVTLPNGEQHAFQFFPVPTNYSQEIPNPYDPTYDTYWVQFVCVDGSGATLSVPGDIHDPDAATRLTLQYDRGDNVFYGGDIEGNGGQYGYDPASPLFGDQYQVTTADGNVYTIAAANGQLLSTKDPNGNVVTYDNNSVSTDGLSMQITRNTDGTIQNIDVSEVNDGQEKSIGYASYFYGQGDQSGELISTQTRDGVSYGYTYGQSGLAHDLTTVQAGGVTTLLATYDTLGRLTALTDAYGRSASTGVTSSDGSGGSQMVTNLSDPSSPAAAGTQNIYDANGNVSRSIQTLTDASGNVTGYSVTVYQYNYASAGIADELSNIFNNGGDYSTTPGSTNQNALISEIDYAPFIIDGSDDSGLRYAQAPTQMLSETDFYFLGNSDVPGDVGMPATQTQYLGDGSTQVTSYSGYVNGQPGTVTVTVGRDGNSQTTSSTDNYFDANGNLIYSFDALGQGTQYVYSDGTGGLAAGLLLSTWSVSGEQTLLDNDPNTNPTRLGDTPLTLNTYYTSDDVTNKVAGAEAGKLKSSVNASGQLTVYDYFEGNYLTVDQYTLWVDPAGVQNLWVGTTTLYNAVGQATDVFAGEYQDGGTPGVLDLNLYNLGWNLGGIGETPYGGFNGGQPLQTSGTGYDSQGRVSSTTDPYGSTTQYTYDAVGNQVETQNPDQTQVLSVYDAMGRVVWQTDAYYLNGPSPVMATHTVYNSQGQVIETDRYEGTDIEFETVNGQSIRTTYVASQGTLISSTFTYYDPQGRVVETDAPSGLRTGTVYYADGQVQYTGTLNADAAVGGGTDGVFATTDFASYTTYLYNQFDTSTGLPYSGLLYDRTVDANNHWTDTYQDELGRTIFTVYEDGSFTQTLYSVNGQAITSSSPYAPSDLTPPSGLVIPAGGSETVSIAQRNPGDASVATYSVYDASGNLVDVYQPAVEDANPNSATYGQMVAPHWSYTYDQSGDELSQTDPDGNVTSWTYDERGNQLTHTLPGGESESWTYDQYNRVVTHLDLDGNTTWEIYANTPQLYGPYTANPSVLVAEYRYTGSFTPPAVNGADPVRPYQTDWTERTVYVYDDGTTDPSVSYSFPSGEQTHLGRVVEVQEWTNPDGVATETDFTHTTYDPVTGQAASITSNEGTINYAYDPTTGEKVRMWTGTDPDNAPDDTAYAYNALGELTDVYTLVLDGTRYATYTGVDSTTGNPTFTGTPLTTNYAYDAAGNLQTESQPDDTTTTYSYDDENRLTGESVVTTDIGASVFSETYTIQADGLRSDVIDTRYNTDGTVFSQTETDWTYDADGRLTNETLVVLAGGANAPAGYSDAFAFDLAGNRMEEDVTGAQTSTILYTYNSDNQLLTETGTGDGAYQIAYSYDDAGNLVSQVRTGTNPETDSYTWDPRGRMASATVNGTTTTYTYDSNGVRTSETTGGTTTFYLNDPNNPTGYTKAVEELSAPNTTPTRSYILGLAVEGQADATNGALFLLHDGHGSTRALLNASGVIVEQYNYDAYGDLLASTSAQSDASAALTSWLFAGDGEYDAGSEFTYQLARYRDGFRFVSMDSAITKASDLNNANLYRYGASNPSNFNDPSGHDIVGLLTTMGIGESLDDISDSEDFAAERATSDVVEQLEGFDVYFGVESGAASGGLLPHTYIYVPSRYIGIGMQYDIGARPGVGGGYLYIHPMDLEEVKSQSLFTVKIAQFDTAQYALWSSETFILSQATKNSTGLITAQVIKQLNFSYAFVDILEQNTVNCYKWTALAAISALGIARLPI